MGKIYGKSSIAQDPTVEIQNAPVSRELKYQVSFMQKPQLLENSWAGDRESSRSLVVRWKNAKLWLNFVLSELSVNFGSAGGDPTWRLETPPVAGTKKSEEVDIYVFVV